MGKILKYATTSRQDGFDVGLPDYTTLGQYVNEIFGEFNCGYYRGSKDADVLWGASRFIALHVFGACDLICLDAPGFDFADGVCRKIRKASKSIDPFIGFIEQEKPPKEFDGKLENDEYAAFVAQVLIAIADGIVSPNISRENTVLDDAFKGKIKDNFKVSVQKDGATYQVLFASSQKINKAFLKKNPDLKRDGSNLYGCQKRECGGPSLLSSRSELPPPPLPS